MYRIQEQQIEDKTIYTLQEGYVRKFKPNGFGITKEVVWMSRIRTTEANLVTEAYKAAQSMSSEDFKAYAKDQQKHFRGLKIKQVATEIDQAAFDHQQLEAKMTEMITDLQLEAKKYKELKEIASTIVHMIDGGALLQPDSIIVQALRTGLND
jgi:hypothetical protein